MHTNRPSTGTRRRCGQTLDNGSFILSDMVIGREEVEVVKTKWAVFSMVEYFLLGFLSGHAEFGLLFAPIDECFAQDQQ